MSLKQMRYKMIDGKIHRTIFDSELPMEGWSIDPYQAKAEADKAVEEAPKRRRGRPPKE